MSSADDTCSCSRPKCSDFGLGGVSPTRFVKTQCPSHVAVYLVYRLLITLYLFGYFLYVFIVSVRPGGNYPYGYYFIYLTNWGYFLMLFYLFCALWNIIVYAAFMKPSGWRPSDDIPWYFFHRGQWFLFNMYASVAILLSILYWGALYVPGTVNLYFDINFHLLNGLVAIFEIFFTAMVVRLLHFIYPLAFAIVYVSFTGIYYAAMGTDEEGNPYIYPILDYGRRPSLAAGLAVGAVIGVVVVHILVVWGLHKLKVLMFSRCCPSCFPSDREDTAPRDRVEMNEEIDV